MYRDKKVVVVMPAYNAAKTLPQTYKEVREQEIVDGIILVVMGARAPRESVRRAVRSIDRQKIIGIVFNQIDIHPSSYYYSRYYHYYNDDKK